MQLFYYFALLVTEQISQDKCYRRLFRFIRTKELKKGMKTGIKSPDSRDCWPMNSNDSAWLDPLHLPRAPILQHNVSLCHGRTTPLLSPSVMPAASLAAWSRVYGILDFGNPNGTAECRSRARRGGNVPGEGGERWFFNMHFLPSSFPGWLLSFLGISLLRFLNQTSESVMQPRMSRKNIVAFVMPAIFYPSCATARVGK